MERSTRSRRPAPVTDRPQPTQTRTSRQQPAAHRPAPAAEAVESRMFVRTSLPSAPGLPPEMTDEEYVLGVHKFVTEPAKVSITFGATKSMGEGTYEFLRVDVGVTMPCYAEQVPEVQERVAEMVSMRLAEEIEKFLG